MDIGNILGPEVAVMVTVGKAFAGDLPPPNPADSYGAVYLAILIPLATFIYCFVLDT